MMERPPVSGDCSLSCTENSEAAPAPPVVEPAHLPQGSTGRGHQYRGIRLCGRYRSASPLERNENFNYDTK